MKKIFMIIMMAFILFSYDVSAYSVTYLVDGEQKVVETNEKGLVEEIDKPEKDGYIFINWINQKTLQVFDFNKEVEEDIVLVPNWRIDKENNLQKDVANMIQSEKGQDIFNLEDNDKDVMQEVLERLKDPKFIIIGSVLIGCTLIILLINIIVVKKKNKKNKNILEKKPKKNFVNNICRRCGSILDENDEYCPVCRTPVLKK